MHDKALDLTQAIALELFGEDFVFKSQNVYQAGQIAAAALDDARQEGRKEGNKPREMTADEWSAHEDAVKSSFMEALVWCSGSADFGPGGKARKGWLKICQPLIDNNPATKQNRIAM